ncbi:MULTISPECIES: integrase arm-type DNA-binding domain-containing protein [unclassified Afipia]|uniref:tyrosine-type recombinase/integrase n=1 Tax=unclassified Afipia TaxID=2642050 RepID=UPI0004214409|nr:MULTISPECIES: integrase arm-type DNA-binding domain-containing protein [unclassified Afipia]MBQ8105567.1 integrase arm-type DNA-binding domain-containing protein [Afipia sp.]MCS6329336.1 integrase arm-type DNA-binding domain-containing protein [Nitrospira sp.]
MPKINHRINLTDRKVQSLKPAKEGQRYQVMDIEVSGFGVRVTDTGQRTFILRTRYPGGSSASRREIGKYPTISLADAREKARRWMALVKQGIDPSAEEDRLASANATKRENTFSVVVEDWFRDKVRAERKGHEVERDFRSQFFPLWKEKPITELSESDILRFIREKKREAPAQARNLLGNLKRFFAWTVDQRCYGVASSPCDQIKPTKIIGKKKKRNRILNDDELFALWRVTKRLPYPHGPVYRGLMLTALRLNEMADANKAEFNWQQMIWTIPAARMKGEDGEARDHIVPITDAIHGLFDSLPKFKSGPFLFTTNFGKSPVWISSWVKARIDARMLRTLKALARSRGNDPTVVTLPHWVNHDIRRTVRSQLSRLKVTEEAREAVLAHARPGIAGTYDCYDYLEEKREALNLWSFRLSQIVSPPQFNNVIRLHARA